MQEPEGLAFGGGGGVHPASHAEGAEHFAGLFDDFGVIDGADALAIAVGGFDLRPDLDDEAVRPAEVIGLAEHEVDDRAGRQRCERPDEPPDELAFVGGGCGGGGDGGEEALFFGILLAAAAFAQVGHGGADDVGSETEEPQLAFLELLAGIGGGDVEQAERFAFGDGGREYPPGNARLPQFGAGGRDDVIVFDAANTLAIAEGAVDLGADGEHGVIGAAQGFPFAEEEVDDDAGRELAERLAEGGAQFAFGGGGGGTTGDRGEESLFFGVFLAALAFAKVGERGANDVADEAADSEVTVAEEAFGIGGADPEHAEGLPFGRKAG